MHISLCFIFEFAKKKFLHLKLAHAKLLHVLRAFRRIECFDISFFSKLCYQPFRLEVGNVSHSPCYIYFFTIPCPFL